MDKESRKLIKFSNYSLCVTLPKSTIKILGWEKGDIVKMTVDEKKGEILITSGKKQGKHAAKPVKKELVKKSAKLSKVKLNSKKTRW
ncbi:MAG: hypothetical protein Athens101428_162 [Candidatus Berkelbacteria bacterium Athens1014_28]|uniref:SpoVT-AbrB domain-containing protein n=1 Tax=Candidatus Berkelbacteria bacterium Athens1014_28 TaxID=2017145 RepID=A0A554LPL6_9BACT|nr:MAG: hypothetical protein Athens101428_162 [Candidatus Berkelbacteria bacterium Athens1014_28]